MEKPGCVRSAIVLVVLLLGTATSRAQSASEALAEARTRLAQDDGRGAVGVLEATLPGLEASYRNEVLAELRKAYTKAIGQAETEGRNHEAAAYRENLAILDRATSPPFLGPSPTSSAGETLPDPSASPSQPTAPEARPEREETETRGSARAQPAEPEPLLPGAIPTEPSGAHSDAPDEPPPDLARADAAFRAKKYEQAGQVYDALFRQGQLPPSRVEAWVYCRLNEVVKRINAGPRTAEDWSALQTEVEQISRISPKNWFAAYLRNLIIERSGRDRRAPSNKVVLRGSQPEEPARPRAGSSPSRVPAEPGPLDVRTESGPGRPSTTVAPASASGTSPASTTGEFDILETPNFRILHRDAKLAQQVAEIAESTRTEQMKRWGSALETRWEPRCDLYLYPTASRFHERTGQPEASPGFSTMGVREGRVIARRVNLRVDHPNFMKSVLPHEVTHVVLADLFTDLQIPRWADEGMAVLSEPSSEQDLRAAELAGPLVANRLFRVADLMSMDYPDGRYWSLYYAQSVSLTRYLVELGTPRQFVDFLKASQRNGIETELKRAYGIASLDELQKRWLNSARAHPAVASASAPRTASVPGNTARE